MEDYHWDELVKELGEEQFQFLEYVSYLWMRRTGLDIRNGVYKDLLKHIENNK